MKSQHVMVIAPHPDDETLGCGGTLLKFRNMGIQITWVIVTDMSPELGYDQAQIFNRSLEIEAVAKDYGIPLPRKMGYPCSKIGNTDMALLVRNFRTLIEELKPDTIFMPNRSDVHSDHRIIADAIWAAVKPFRCPWVKNVFMYETPSETDMAPPLSETMFLPQVHVDITPFIDKKIAIMNRFAGEMAQPPFPRSEQNLRALARWRGSAAGFHYAESFMLLRGLIG